MEHDNPKQLSGLITFERHDGERYLFSTADALKILAYQSKGISFTERLKTLDGWRVQIDVSADGSINISDKKYTGLDLSVYG
jgi:hypothetical protein